jgi:hypothetical protein
MCWLIKKRGLYYRPNRKGYTKYLSQAGRYTKDEAVSESFIDPFTITFLHEDEAPDCILDNIW